MANKKSAAKKTSSSSSGAKRPTTVKAPKKSKNNAGSSERPGSASHCFGSHMSIAGGLEKAIERAEVVGCDCVQIFSKNNNQWKCKPLTDDQVQLWNDMRKKIPMRDAIAHASYLINLGSPDEELWQKSIAALVIEWQRADALELSGLVVHPGAFTTSSESEGMQRIADGVKAVLDQIQPKVCRLLLENTAGQGSCLGHTFAQLGWLLEKISSPEWTGVCLDTCHAFAAGYEINQESGFQAMRRELDSELPTGVIRALHLNDSKKPCGSRVDRHEHIGMGEIGDAGFRFVLADDRLGGLPGYLETEKGENDAGEDWDLVNLRRLRSLV